MIIKLAAASIISYILFLLPYILSALTILPEILVIIVLLAAIASATISGLLLHGFHPIIPPLAGSAASLLTNHLSGIFLGASAQVYFDWPYWALGFLASPVLALPVASLRAEREIEAAEVMRPEVEVAEEKMELIQCPACGGQIPSDSIYCPSCGSRVAEEI